MNSKREFTMKCMSNQWAQVDDTTAQELIVSCCTEANDSVADECQMNRNVKKWTSMSEGSDNFAMLEDCLFILIFPSMN